MPKEVKWAISLAVGLGLLALGWKVYFMLVTLHVVICGLLIVVIMLQSGEAADLAGAFGGAGSQTAFGPRGAATFLSQATTWCAIMFMLTSMTLVLRQDKAIAGFGSVLENKVAKPPATPPQNKLQLPLIPGPASGTQPQSAPSSTPPASQSAQPAKSAPPKTQPPKK